MRSDEDDPATPEAADASEATAWGRPDWEPTPEQEAEIERLVSSGLARWAVRIAMQAPPLTPEQIRIARAVFAPAVREAETRRFG